MLHTKLSDAVLLERLGCSKQTQATYAALSLETSKSISELAQEQCMHRPALYRGIDELMKRGFVVGTTHGKRTLYKKVPRGVLIQAFADDVARLQNTPIKQSEHTSVFSLQKLHGQHAVRDVFDDVVTSSKRGDTFYRITSERSVAEVDALLSPRYRIDRDKKKLERKVISGTQAMQQKRNRLERFIRAIDVETIDFNHNIIELIYGNKIAYIDITKSEALIIEHRALSAFNRALFLSLYKKL